MIVKEARSILSALAEGENPLGGLPLPGDHPCRCEGVQQALRMAARALTGTRYRAWTRTEDDALFCRDGAETAQGLAERLGRSPYEVKCRLMYLGLRGREGMPNPALPLRSGTLWYPEEDALLARAFCGGVPQEELARRFRRTGKAIASRLQALGLTDGEGNPLPAARGGETVPAAHAAGVLEALLQGSHPVTGRTLPMDDACAQPDVLRALHMGVCALHTRAAAQAAPRIAEEANPAKRRDTPWTPEEEDRLCALVGEGRPLRQISRRLNRTLPEVRRHLQAVLSPYAVLDEPSPWSDAEDRQLRTWYGQGKRLDFIAEELNRSEPEVRARLLSLHETDRWEDAVLAEEADVRFRLDSRRGKCWSAGERQQLQQMFERRESAKKMARTLGRSERAVLFQLSALGLHDQTCYGIPEERRRWSDEDTLALTQLYEAGCSVKVMALRFNCSEAALRARLFYLGLSKDAPDVLPHLEEPPKA